MSSRYNAHHVSVLAFWHLLISTKDKVQQRLLGTVISFGMWSSTKALGKLTNLMMVIDEKLRDCQSYYILRDVYTKF